MYNGKSDSLKVFTKLCIKTTYYFLIFFIIYKFFINKFIFDYKWNKIFIKKKFQFFIIIKIIIKISK